MRSFLLFPILLTLLVMVCGGCGGPSQQSGGNDQAQAGANGLPELTKEVIDERINDARVYDVMPESGTGMPIPWSFDHDEPKEIVVVDKQVDGLKATTVLDIKTESSPRSKVKRYLAGQVRMDWRLETGWVLRRWEIVNVENISMKYRDIPNPLPENSNNASPK